MDVDDQLYASTALPLRMTTHGTAGWMGPESVWTGAENLAFTGIRSPDRPAQSESAFRLHHPAVFNSRAK